MVLSRVKQKVEQTLAPYLPTIEEKFHEVMASMGAKTKEVAGDDHKMRRVLKTVHGRLPFMVRMAVKEEPFVEFCMRNKSRFVPTEEQGDGDANADQEQDSTPRVEDNRDE